MQGRQTLVYVKNKQTGHMDMQTDTPLLTRRNTLFSSQQQLLLKRKRHSFSKTRSVYFQPLGIKITSNNITCCKSHPGIRRQSESDQSLYFCLFWFSSWKLDCPSWKTHFSGQHLAAVHSPALIFFFVDSCR